METLDKVIKVMSVCDETQRLICIECPYTVDCKDVPGKKLRADALYYLREYQEHMKWHAYEEHCLDNEKKTLQEKKAELDEVLTDYVALKQWWTEQQENPPLTWDELKTMEGKPVWIDSVPLVRRWVIIKKFHPIGGNKNLFDMEVEDGGHFLRKNMRRDDPAWWQAYRKEKNE